MKDNHPISVQSFEAEIQQLQLLFAHTNFDDEVVGLFPIGDRIRNLWNRAQTSQEKASCIEIASSMPVGFLKESLLLELSMDSYQTKDYQTAFYGFAKGAQEGSLFAKNNLAYMLRRGEHTIDGINCALSALELLKPGIKEKEPFSLVNAALVLCLSLKKDDDWKTADKLFECISPSSAQSVYSWWENLGCEIESYFVHFFLLRHKKIDSSSLGSVIEIAKHLKENLADFPEWLVNEYCTETSEEPHESLSVDDEMIIPAESKNDEEELVSKIQAGDDATMGKTAFTVLDENGKEVRCEPLFSFESSETGKTYIIYTDNSKDEDGNTRVFASVLCQDSDGSRLAPIETEKEWSIIEIILNELQNGKKEGDEERNE